MRTPSLLKAKLAGTTFLSGAGVRQLRERDQLWVVPLAAAGILVGVAGAVWMLYQNYLGMASLGAVVGHPELPLYVATVVAWVLMFVVGFPIALSVLYFSRDTLLLAALPLPAYQIVAANLGLLYLYSIPVAILVFVPAMVAAASVATVTWFFVVAGVVVTLVSPLVPLALSVLLMMGLTRLVNLSRYRTLLEALGMVLMVVLLLAMQLGLSRSMTQGVGEGEISTQLAEIVLRLQGAVPPARWHALAMVPGDPLMLLAAVACGVAAIGAGGLVVQAGYLRQISEYGAVRSRPRRRAQAGAADLVLPPSRSRHLALVGREIRILTSNSTFVFESAGEVLIFPILLLVFRLSMPAEVVDQFLPFLTSSPYLLPITTGALLLMASINSVTSAAISREGPTFDLSLSLPVSGADQVGAKLVTYLALFCPAFVLNSILAVWILRQPWWAVPVMAVVGIPVIVAVGEVTLSADIRRPLLNWNHPQQAVKQNMNVLIGMGMALVTICGLALPGVILALMGAGAIVVMLATAAAAGIGAVAVRRVVHRYADRRYGNAFS